MLRLVLRLNTKKMCKNSVKNLSFVIRYVPDRYKTRKMCDEVILVNDRNLKSLPD